MVELRFAHIQALSNLRVRVGEGLLGVYHHAVHRAVFKVAAGIQRYDTDKANVTAVGGGGAV